MIPGLGGDNDMGLHAGRSHRHRGRTRLAFKLAAGLLAAAAILAVCTAVGFARALFY